MTRVGLGLGLLVLVVAVVYEANTSRLQSRYFASVAEEMRYQLEPGPSDSIAFPSAGPYDTRLGYTRIAGMTDTLEAQGFRVVSQARGSAAMLKWAERGIGPIYSEKTQAGLRILDPSDRDLYSSRYPRHAYDTFQAIPPVLVRTLLFIENRELLQTRHARHNPAVEWDRLAKATLEALFQKVDSGRHVAGGSTLATQIEKYRHSPGGWTSSPKEKVRQMLAASIRAYRGGIDTSEERRRIFRDYVNSIPLAAAPRHGEVNGLGDGLWAWYGASFDEINRLLADRPTSAPGESRSAEPPSPDPASAEPPSAEPPEVESMIGEPMNPDSIGQPLTARSDLPDARGVAYRQALSLMLAQRRPTYYLIQDPAALADLTDSYVRILARAGVIDPELREAALHAEAPIHTPRLSTSQIPLVESKTAVSIRSRLVALLGLQDLYELDRLDLRAEATVDDFAQREVIRFFQELRDPVFANQEGFLESRLLQKGALASVVYSMTLYERTANGNLLRVQADTFDRAVNLNEGARLELGSTAKLRTLTTYLEIIAELYHQHSVRTPAELRNWPVHSKDPLSRWVVDFLLVRPDASIEQILEAAMLRRYSASPAEKFFTGGGVHEFANFDSKHDTQFLTLRESFQNSVNLVFIRLMRDIVRYHTYRGSSSERFLESLQDTLRQAYLQKFADREGSDFLRRFYRKYQDMGPAQMESVFLDGVRATPRSLSNAFLSLYPSAGEAELGAFLRGRLDETEFRDKQIAQLYADNGPEKIGLEDRGYIARVHPLELWLVGYRLKNPDAGISRMLAESYPERQQVYTWLFRTKRRNAQDVRIRGLLEIEAFLEIQRSWARLGYPFANLVPSYATAIGSSGDRPAALADLMGIILNGGVRQSNVRVNKLGFAGGTPYETNLEREEIPGKVVMDAAVATRLREELVGVVQFGTARRAFESVTLPDGTVLPIGGKTGTGDNRIKVTGPGGQLKTSKVANRTASFVFLVGDRYYGTIVAYVPGDEARNYNFTSALPVQIWKRLAPRLQPMFAQAAAPVEATEVPFRAEATEAPPSVAATEVPFPAEATETPSPVEAVRDSLSLP